MQLREKSTEGVPATAAKRDSLPAVPTERKAYKRRAALDSLQSSELCSPTASLAWSWLQTQTSPRLRSAGTSFSCTSSSLGAHLTHGHLPNTPTEQPLQEAQRRCSRQERGMQCWMTPGDQTCRAAVTPQRRDPLPPQNQTRLSSIGSLGGTAWPGQGPWGPEWGKTYTLCRALSSTVKRQHGNICLQMVALHFSQMLIFEVRRVNQPHSQHIESSGQSLLPLKAKCNVTTRPEQSDEVEEI